MKYKEPLILLLCIVVAGPIVFGPRGLVHRVNKSYHQRLANECKRNEVKIGFALEQYATDNEGRYPASLQKIVPKYISCLPTCPVAQKDTYSIEYFHSVSPDTFRLVCSGHYHSLAELPPNEPRYATDDPYWCKGCQEYHGGKPPGQPSPAATRN